MMFPAQALPVRCTTVLLFLCFSATALAQDSAPARDALERFSQGLEALQADFTQTIVDTEGRAQEHSSGTLWLSRPDRLRWEYEGDFPEIIVADGRRVWLYDIELEQVTVRNQAEYASGSPFMLLTGLEGLDEQFRVTEAGDFDDLNLLMLTAHEPSSEFERILVGLDHDTVRLMTLEDAFGLRTEIRFTAVERNPELDSGLFEFNPPETVDVVGLELTEPDAGTQSNPME